MCIYIYTYIHIIMWLHWQKKWLFMFFFACQPLLLSPSSMSLEEVNLPGSRGDGEFLGWHRVDRELMTCLGSVRSTYDIMLVYIINTPIPHNGYRNTKKLTVAPADLRVPGLQQTRSPCHHKAKPWITRCPPFCILYPICSMYGIFSYIWVIHSHYLGKWQ